MIPLSATLLYLKNILYWPEDDRLQSKHVAAIIIIIIIIFIYCNWVVTGGSGYFTCIQNMKLVTTKFKSGGLHDKHVVATWNLGKHFSICL